MKSKVYGPYTRKDGRKHVCVITNNKRRTVSYPKWLVEQKLGRILSKDETVDHIDRNKSNDNLINLQILLKPEHSSLDAKRCIKENLKCLWCSKLFTRSPVQIRNNARKNKSGPFCGKACAGRYSRAYQLNRIEKYPIPEIKESRFYYRDKA